MLNILASEIVRKNAVYGLGHFFTSTIVILFCLAALLSPAQASSGTADFYIASEGNDAWSGRLPEPTAAGTDGPFATLTRALATLSTNSKPPPACGSELGYWFVGGRIICLSL